MADVKISALPAAVSVAQVDLIPIVQGGTSKQAAVSLVAPLLANIMTLDGTQSVTGAKTFGSISDLGTPGAGNLSNCTNFPKRVIGATFDGGGSAVSTGKAKGYYTSANAWTIAGWSISVDTGTCTFDVWKIAAGTAVPTVSNKITTSGVALATGTHIRSTDVTDFGANTAVAVGDIIAFNLTTTSGPTQITFELEMSK